MYNHTLIVLFPAIFYLQTVNADIDHYWTNQFGGSASLLSGSNISSVNDASATYYNPGALGRIKHSSVSFNGNAYGFESMKIKDGTGPGSNLETSNVLTLPTMLAGVKKTSPESNHTFAYSLITRNKFSALFNSRRDEDNVNVLDDSYSAGNEEYIGQYAAKIDVEELWGGVSWAYKISEKLSFGATAYVGYLTHNVLHSVNVRAVPKTAGLDIATIDVSALTDVNSVRAFAKFGLAYENGQNTYGLTYTTTSINLTGENTVASDFTVTNVDLGLEGVPFSFAGNDRQEGLDTTIKSPRSIAFGAGFPIRDNYLVNIAIEHFFAVSRYNVNTPEQKEFFRPSDSSGLLNAPSEDYIGVSDARKSVTNVALGLSFPIYGNYKLLSGFRTDFSAAPGDDIDAEELFYSEWDLYHVSTGLEWERKDEVVSLGLVYSFSVNHKGTSDVSFINPSEDGFLLGPEVETEANLSSFLITIGYIKYL